MTEFKMIDTKDLQIESLLEFAKSLGYVPVASEWLCQGFRTLDMCTDEYMDTDFVFNEGKIVSRVNHHKDCYGKKEYISYGY